MRQKPVAPEFGGVPVGASELGGASGWHAFSHKQDKAATLDDLLWCAVGFGPLLKFVFRVVCKFDRF